MKIAVNKKFPEEMIAELQQRLPEDCELVKVSFGKLTEKDRELLRDIEFAIGGACSPQFLDAAPRLKVFQVPWVGVNQLDLRLMKEKGITVCNSKWNDKIVAEYAISLLLACSKRLVEVDKDFRTGYWRSRYWPSVDIYGSKGLLIGYGSIGKNIAQFLKCFNVELYALKRRKTTEDKNVKRIITWEEYPSIAPLVDFVIVTLPQTPETEGILNKERLDQLKNGVIFINVGRGATVDEQALFEAVKNKKIGCAGIDVWYNYHREGKTVEPVYPSNYPFHELPNVILSPHRAANFTIRPPHYWDDVIFNLQAFAQGKALKNVVDLDAGY